MKAGYDSRRERAMMSDTYAFTIERACVEYLHLR
jgi:hypothetical protein